MPCLLALPPTGTEDVRRLTGFMPDYAGVYAHTTVFEYLGFPCPRAQRLHHSFLREWPPPYLSRSAKKTSKYPSASVSV